MKKMAAILVATAALGQGAYEPMPTIDYSSPIFTPRKHTKQSYAAQNRAAKKRRKLMPKDQNSQPMTARQIMNKISHISKLINICITKGNQVDTARYSNEYESLMNQLRSKLKVQ